MKSAFVRLFPPKILEEENIALSCPLFDFDLNVHTAISVRRVTAKTNFSINMILNDNFISINLLPAKINQVLTKSTLMDYSQGMSTMADLRYKIDISGLLGYPDLNISQTFDPPIYGYIVKIHGIRSSKKYLKI